MHTTRGLALSMVSAVMGACTLAPAGTLEALQGLTGAVGGDVSPPSSTPPQANAQPHTSTDAHAGSSAGGAPAGGPAQPMARWRVVGRAAPSSSGATTMTWPYVQVLGQCTQSASLRPRFADVAGDNAFVLRVDHRAGARFDPRQPPTVDGLDPAAVHTVTLVRVTEAQYGQATFVDLELDTAGRWLAPPAPLTRRIVFVGDSITAGYGD